MLKVFQSLSKQVAESLDKVTKAVGQISVNKSRNGSVVCFRCNEKGHYSRQCPTTAPEQTGSKKASNENAPGKENWRGPGVPAVRHSACHLTGVDNSPNGMETGTRASVLLMTGCYVVPVRIGAGVVEFLVDSGSAATVLSAAAFETAERDTRAVLRESKLNLCTASGQTGRDDFRVGNR